MVEVEELSIRALLLENLVEEVASFLFGPGGAVLFLVQCAAGTNIGNEVINNTNNNTRNVVSSSSNSQEF